MADETHDPKATQQTPKGATIPVPKREHVERDLRKLIAPDRSAVSPATNPTNHAGENQEHPDDH
jgi:hypothetical protein